MAVAQPHREKEWEQWKGEMEESRRRRWRSWVRCWTDAEVSANEGERGEDWSQWEAQRAALEKEELSEEEREDESERKIEEEGGEEEAEGRLFAKIWEETRMRKRRGESDVEKESDEEVEGKCEKEVDQEDGGVGEGYNEVNWNERKVNESKREEDENDKTIHELEEIEQDDEKEGLTREIGGNEDNDVVEDGKEGEFEVDEMEENGSRGKVGDEDRLDHMLDNQDNTNLNTSVEEIRKEVIERREARDVGGDLEEYDDVGEEYMVDDEEEGKKELVMEVVEQETCSAENNFQGPTEYENEDSSQSDFEDEHLNCVELKKKELEMHESNMEEPSMETTFQKESRCSGRDEEEVQSDNIAPEMLQDDDFGLQEEEEDEEEESTDEEECSAEEGEDTCEENVVKVYQKDNFVIDFFGTLNEFRQSSVLTDLILTTVDGKSLHVHNAVMAAVSTHIRSSLSPRDVENITVGDCRERGLTRRSVSLGPEVDHVGLDAVVEFAYTGLITCPHMDTIHHVKKAAESLGAIRVLEICREVEERSKNTQEQVKDVASAEEEMVKTLQCIKQLWAEGAGCDVTLEVLGGSFHGQSHLYIVFRF